MKKDITKTIVDINKTRFSISFSNNKKTGFIPVSTSPKTTCPSSCPLLNNGCYAAIGPMNIHWDKITDGTRGISWKEHLQFIKGLQKHQLWRLNQAGDLPSRYVNGSTIDAKLIRELISANKGKNGFGYTHKIQGKKNKQLIREANENGLTINASCESFRKAKKLKDEGIPSVCIVKNDNVFIGKELKICPAQLSDKITCSQCAWCQNSKRHWVVGFLPHGVMKNKVSTLCED